MAGLAALLEQLAQAGTSVHVRQGRLGVSPQAALARFAPLLKEHRGRLLELASAAGGTLPPERLAELGREMVPAPQLEGWAHEVIVGADVAAISYPVLIDLRDPEPNTRSLTRLCYDRDELVVTLAELSRYTPREARLLRPKTLGKLVVWGNHGAEEPTRVEQ